MCSDGLPVERAAVESAGYSGIEAFVSSDGGRSYGAAPVYWRQEMFGTYERGAVFTHPAPDFVFDQWTIHAFPEVARSVTHLMLHFGHADQSGDSAVSFDSIRVDLEYSYAAGAAEPPEPAVTAVDANCVPSSDGPLDIYSLSGTLFECSGFPQSYTVQDCGGAPRCRINMWLSGGGGGFGSQSHPPNTGAAAGLTWGSVEAAPGDELKVYVGCAGESGNGAQGIGGAGGGASAVIGPSGDVLLVAGASGGQAGAWDHNRQVEGELSSTHGGHGGGPIGEDGGTTPCNGDALGGGGANQEAAGAGGTSNRDYDLGQPGTGNALGAEGVPVGGNGGAGGGQGGDETCHTAGGFGFGNGGCGRAVFGDGGGGGGGGGWFGGGGGGGACHGTGGGGGSGYVSGSVRGDTMGGRGVPEGQDGFVVITAEDCANLSGNPPEVQHAGGAVAVASAAWASDGGDVSGAEGVVGCGTGVTWGSEATHNVGENNACDNQAEHGYQVCNENCDNIENREEGAMAEINNAIYPASHFVRFRTGSAEGYKVWLELASPTDLSGISIKVGCHGGTPNCNTAGYSGIEVFVSSDGGRSYGDTPVYWRQEMFGTYERGALFTDPAPDFLFDEWTTHAFSTVASQVTNVMLHFGHADQNGDSAVSFDSIRVDRVNSYALGVVEPPEPPVSNSPVDDTCAPVTSHGPLDFESLGGNLFSCVEDVQRWKVPVGVTYVHVFMSGGGGGFGSQAHPPNTGGAAGLAYAELQVQAGERLFIHVGCRGTDGQESQGKGGGGGGASAILNDNGDVLVVAGGSGGQAGAWDASRQAAGRYEGMGQCGQDQVSCSATHGGHGGGAEGEQGGTTPCNDMAAGGGGGTQDQVGAAGESNRGYDPGQPGQAHSGDQGGNGGDGGGQNGDDSCTAPGGWGWGSGGCGRDVPGDGGGGGGGGGYNGGGGGGGACHGTGGGGGSGFIAPLRGVGGFAGTTQANSGLLGGRGVPEAQDGWVVISTDPCGTPASGAEAEASSVGISAATMANDNGDDNRDDADPMNSIAPLDQLLRYRVGSHNNGFTLDLTLDALVGGADVQGVSTLVHRSADFATGYSGIEISVSDDRGASFRLVYSRYEMFGTFERAAMYESEAADFAFDRWTTHAFTGIERGVTHVRLHFGMADQQSDECFSLHSLRVDAAGAYRVGSVGITQPPRVGEWCLPEDETTPVDYERLLSAAVQSPFACQGSAQQYVVPAGATMVNVWLSGAGGGFGSRPHGPLMGAAAGLTYGTLAVTPGETLTVYVVRSHSKCRHSAEPDRVLVLAGLRWARWLPQQRLWRARGRGWRWGVCCHSRTDCAAGGRWLWWTGWR